MRLSDRNSKRLWLLIPVLLAVATGKAFPQSRDADLLITNGPIVYRATLESVTNVVPPWPAMSFRPAPTNLPLEIRRALLSFVPQGTYRYSVRTNTLFDHFIPTSVRNLVWTNLIAHTNGRSTVIWSTRWHPPGWPAVAPALQWNTNGLMWGMKGLTALSPCWELEGSSGQVPITVFTRRHGYTRGHGMGADGFRKNYAGKKVWFVTRDNRIVEAKIAREVVRTFGVSSHNDYTIVLFDHDLPEGIDCLRVTDSLEVFGVNSKVYPFCYGGPNPLFKTEQGGQVDAELPGFSVNSWKGGDSGSPNMLPLPGELVFVSGRSTSGACPEMQADMDQLCRLEGLDPRKYQLHWVKLE